MARLSDLTLVKATAQQAQDISKHAFVQWGRGLDWEQFSEVYRSRAEQEQSVNGKRIAWVLVPRSNPESLDYLCFCETFRREAVIARPQDAQPTRVVGYGVASVLTPPDNRGHGYASHMMRLLHWVLAPRETLPPFPSEWGLPPSEGPRDGQFSVLYSGIGSKFYHNCGPTTLPGSGWETVSPVSTFWQVDTDTDSPVDTNDWTLLNEEDAYRIWEEDVKIMENDVAAAAKSTGKVAFAFFPTGGVAKYTIESFLWLDPTVGKFWGVARRNPNSSAPSPDTYATWSHELGTKTIVLTRIRSSADDFPALLEKLKEGARAIGRDKIEVWNIPEHLQEAAKKAGGQTLIRENHLSAVKWYGPEATDRLTWCFNEMFCSC